MPLFPPPVKIPLPIQESVRDFFVDLLGKGASVDKSVALTVTRPGGQDLSSKLVVAVYVDKREDIKAICLADMLLAAASGAALVLTPASVLPEVEQAGELPDSLRENYQEVANILSSLLNTPSTPHLKLSEMKVLPEDLPEEAWAIIENPGTRRDYTLTVEGYTSGRFSLLAR